MKSSITHLKAFDCDMSFEQLNEDYLNDFLRFLQNKEYVNSTLSKDIFQLKYFLRWACKKGLYSGDVHESFKPKFKGIDGNNQQIIYLTWQELLKLYNLELSQKPLDRVKDLFCFLCFTGLRYSDLAKLKRSDIKDKHISVLTQKTRDLLIIELNDYSKAIIDKYSDDEFEDDLALPVISNVQMNAYLKELGKLAELNDSQRVVKFIGNRRMEYVYSKHELLTTHCGRRTFVVNALYLGIPAEVIMKWTGHSDFKSMKPYMKIVDELKENEMNKFNKVEVIKITDNNNGHSATVFYSDKTFDDAFPLDKDIIINNKNTNPRNMIKCQGILVG